MALFSSEEQAAIARAVAEVESNTAAELVVAAVEEAGDSRFYRLVAAVGMSIGGLGAGAIWCTDWPALHALALAPFVVGGMYFLLGLSGLLRWTPDQAAEAAVHRKAMQLFAERGVYRTRDRSGVLICFAKQERKVVILGDEGVDRVLSEGAWEAYADRLSRSIAEGRALEELSLVLRELGEVLAREFPARKEDENELSNEVVVE